MDSWEPNSYMEYAMNVQSNASYASSNESMKSCPKEKDRDGRITELEDELAKAEDRCLVFRNQVAYMKMLYTGSHLTKPSLSEENVKVTMNVEEKLSSANVVTYWPKNHNTSAPANMAIQPFIGTIANDPKEAMQQIVNEMTQSVNAVEGSVEIHSNTMEGLLSGSRSKETKIIRKDHFMGPRAKKLPKKLLVNRLHVQKVAADKKSNKSMGSASLESKKSAKNVKRKHIRSLTASPRNQPGVLPTKEPPKKPENVCAGQHVRKFSSNSQGVPDATSSTYLIPTLSHRMKCVPKSYRREFSFQRIPFVLGKSTNKSHNIGTKIQQTLSLIKLSRKGPQSGNLGKKDEFTKLINLGASEEQSVSAAERSSRHAARSGQVKQRSPMTVGATTDYKNYQLRTVLMNLHDEFSKMTENYETMKASLAEKDDPQIAQQLQSLEDELNAKEIEINAFMNLYNEVTELKDQLSSKGFHQPGAIYRPSSVNLSESTTTLKMTRLLRRIEQFQDQLKTLAYI